MSEQQPQLWLEIRLPEDDDDAMLQVALLRTRSRDAYRWTVARRQTNMSQSFLVELPPGMPDPEFVGRLKLELGGFGNKHPAPTHLAERMREGVRSGQRVMAEDIWSQEGTPAYEAERIAVGLTDEVEIQILLQRFFLHLSEYQTKRHSRYNAELGELSPQESFDLVLSKWSMGDQGFRDWLWRMHIANGEPPKPNPGIDRLDVFWVAAAFPDIPRDRFKALHRFKARAGRHYGIRRPTENDPSAAFLVPMHAGLPRRESVMRIHRSLRGFASPNVYVDHEAMANDAFGRGYASFFALYTLSIDGTPANVAEKRVLGGDISEDLGILVGAYLYELSRYQSPSSDTYHRELAELSPGKSFEMVIRHWKKGDQGFARWLGNFQTKVKRDTPSTPQRHDASRDAYSSESVTLEDGSKATIVTSGLSGISALFRGNTLIASGPRASLLPNEGH